MQNKKRESVLAKTQLDSRVQAYMEACRTHGIRLTPQRIEIYREVAATEEHPDAETIYSRVKQRFPGISRDTVYRTLYTLEEQGMLSRLQVLSERVRFDANKKPHHHFICLKCGSVYDFYSPILDDFQPPRAVRDMGSVESAHLELRGICAKCGKGKIKRKLAKDALP